jgi:predicted phage terminase large subunit-like protein
MNLESLSVQETKRLLAQLKQMRDQAVQAEIQKNRLPGDDLILQDSERLMGFITHAWHILEPSQKLKSGWAINGMAEHFEAITNGELGNTLFNVVPGIMKSLMSKVFWPAWWWGPMNCPWVRFISASYSSMLSERDALKLKQLVESDWYQRLWPHVKISPDQSAKTNFHTTQRGFMMTTSVSGVGTGTRGDVFICFPYWQHVMTERGPIPIGDIVQKRMNVRVWSTDIKTGKTSLKPITGWHKNPSSRIIEVGLSDGTAFQCTPEHRIWTHNGWVEAQRLCASDSLPSCSVLNRPDQSRADAVKQRQRFICKLGFINLKHLFISKFRFRREHTVPSIAITPMSLCNAGPSIAPSYLLDRGSFNTVFFSKFMGGFSALSYFDRFFSCQFSAGSFFKNRESAVPFGIPDILGARAVTKVIQPIIQGISVLVPYFVLGRRGSDKSKKDNLVNVDMSLSARSPVHHVKTQIALLIIRRLQNTALHMIWLIKSGCNTVLTAYAPHVANTVKSLPSRNRKPIFIRDVCHADSTFCLSVADNHTFIVGNRNGMVLVSNCDDPNNVLEAESEAIRRSTNRWFTEVVPTRINDPNTSVIIVIQQRTHENDVSGVILGDNKDKEYEHFCLPMRFEVDNRCQTKIGFIDPRTKEGELVFPERFPEWWVAKKEKKMGPYATAAQFQQRPTPRGGGIVRLEDWQMWEHEEFPDFEFVIACLDTNYSEEEQEDNDYNGLVFWGVFRDHLIGQPQAMLMYSWQDRDIKLHDLVTKVGKFCMTMRADKLLIEDKGKGSVVKSELRRLFQNKVPASLVKVSGAGKNRPMAHVGDKVARTYACQHLFHDGLIWRPKRTWADAVANQIASIPKGAHDDLADPAVMGLNFLRLSGFILRPEEGTGEHFPYGRELLNQNEESVYDV